VPAWPLGDNRGVRVPARGAAHPAHDAKRPRRRPTLDGVRTAPELAVLGAAHRGRARRSSRARTEDVVIEHLSRRTGGRDLAGPACGVAQ
jgi:hypothetical protein